MDPTAIILAAGAGRRIAQAHAEPKCLLRFNGRTLLERHLHCLARAGVDRIVLCVGYRADRVRAELERLGAARRVRIVENPEWEQGSVITLWAARAAMDGAESLIMDADVLYAPEILERLVRSPVENCFLLDRGFEPGEEPVKLCVAGSRLVEFRKRLAPDLAYDYCGESVGFFRFGPAVGARLARRTEHYRAAGRGNEPHEEAIRDLLLESPGDFGFEDVTGLPWLEIDFAGDIERAERSILPRLQE
ncbi:MAG: NTP transferase domain-containing protein [Gammaproteobacteria bacterium]